MTAPGVPAAAIGFLLAIALPAGGGPDSALAEKLDALRAEIARLEAPRPQSSAPLAARPHRAPALVQIDELVRTVADALPPHSHGDTVAFDRLAAAPRRPLGTRAEVAGRIESFVRKHAGSPGRVRVLGPKDGACTLAILHRPEVVAAVRRFVDDKLRPAARRTISIQARVVEPAPAAKNPLQGRVIRGVRILALSGQRALLWHGGQHALAADAEASIAKEDAGSTTPIVHVEILGGILDVRASAGTGTERIRVELGFRHRRLGGVRTRKTRAGVRLQLPTLLGGATRGTFDVPDGQWFVAGEFPSRTGPKRFLIVRATRVAG